MEEMKKTTEKMNKTTNEMSETTKQLAVISQGMSHTTNQISDNAKNTYRDMRLDTSVSNGFKALNEMEQAKSLEQKMIAAAYYYASFEFQLWKNKEGDSDELREKMFAFAMKRLFIDIKEYFKNSSEATVRPPTRDEVGPDQNRLANLYALAAMVHELNPNQEAVSKLNNVKLVSTYDLIKDGLSAIHAEKTGKISLLKATEHAQVVAQNEELAVFILQLRYNILVAKTLSMVTNLASTIKETALKKAVLSEHKWNTSLEHLSNTAVLSLAIKAAGAAIETRHVLQKNGYMVANMLLNDGTITPNVDLATVLKNMTTVDAPKDKSNAEHQALVKKLNEFLNSLK